MAKQTRSSRIPPHTGDPPRAHHHHPHLNRRARRKDFPRHEEVAGTRAKGYFYPDGVPRNLRATSPSATTRGAGGGGSRQHPRRSPPQVRPFLASFPSGPGAPAPHSPSPAALPADRRLPAAPGRAGGRWGKAVREGRRAAPARGPARPRERRGAAAGAAALRSYSDPPIKGGQSARGGHVTGQFQLRRRIFWISGVTQRTLIEGGRKKGQRAGAGTPSRSLLGDLKQETPSPHTDTAAFSTGQHLRGRNVWRTLR